MAPTLFIMMFSTMVIDAFHDCGARFCFDCKLFNLRRLQEKAQVNMYINVLNELLHADHIIELTISTKMIVVVNQPSPGNPYRKQYIT